MLQSRHAIIFLGSETTVHVINFLSLPELINRSVCRIYCPLNEIFSAKPCCANLTDCRQQNQRTTRCT